ncbi:hypothetical protein K492DRAFT_186767 [Lichtheimia hyalospora FSU 10163]|nr:hypothetical protein K492DRAFT_186767 [Lichtheimia hyalospora FSU 10163]
MPKYVVFDSTEDLPEFFHEVLRKSINDFKGKNAQINLKQLGEYIHEQVEVNGNPLVIGDFDTLPSWDRDLFHLDQFLALYQDTVQVYHMGTRNTTSMSTTDFLNGLQQRNENELQDKDNQHEENDNTKKRFIQYGKDLSCPAVIQQKLQSMLPKDILPLDSTDLFVHMPKHLRAENLMCYVGSDGTGTAVHRDICATLGHNLMIYGDEKAYSEWYMITNDERSKLLQALHPIKRPKSDPDIGQPIESSTFVETDRAWVGRKHVNQQHIKTHVLLQHPGDLVLVPSMCYHQVRNINTSIKVAWNRATPRSLQMAVQKQLPIYQQLIRPEVYRCKAMVYRTILTLTNKERNTLAEYEECRILADLFYYDILLPEAIEPIPTEDVDDKNIYCDMKIRDDMFEGICDFCHADIFYRYYHCSDCNYDICMACYSQGRSCTHMDQLVMAQGIIPFDQLVKVYIDFINTINDAFKGFKRIPCRLAKDGSFPFDDKQYNLATLCRRVEKYRQRNKMFSNYFSCGHCHKVASLEELYNKEQLNIVDIFGQRPCQTLQSNQELNMAWVDKLVYYMSPENDVRNMGGASDDCINKEAR